MKIIVIYDNTIKPNEIIREVIGEKGFGDVVVKRQQLKDIYKNKVCKILNDAQWIEFNNLYDIDTFLHLYENAEQLDDIHILHTFSDFIICDIKAVALSYQKIYYIEEEICLLCRDTNAAVMFSNMKAYLSFLKQHLLHHDGRIPLSELTYPHISVDGLGYIGEINNFIQCITGNFDSRYFNSLLGTDYYLRKTSSNKKKIKSEYQFYHLLPENMQRWFVLPYDYQETKDTASYAMERLHMTDIAIKWVHGSIEKDEFSNLMDMYFYFFNERSKKEISTAEYEAINKTLYIDKVTQRIEDLKELSEYQKIANLLSNNDTLKSIDEIFAWYLSLKQKVENKTTYPSISVIGHGDPCFANAMYNRSTRTLKFIDPKGALTEEDLWTNPYYDIAKLSHSICGNYDFFNNAMFDITIDDKFDYLLTIPFDNTEYKELFRQKVEQNGFDYWSVRLYEASLFLSMLPLHIDYPHKVFGFILNAINILKEIDENV